VSLNLRNEYHGNPTQLGEKRFMESRDQQEDFKVSQPVIDNFIEFYETFSASSIKRLDNVYDSNVVFVDPIHRVTGLNELQDYFLHLCGGNGSTSFRITHAINSGQHSGDAGKAFFRWLMTYSHPKLAGGRSLELVGGSMVCFDRRVTYQEDFYDLGKMIYQHLPVLGWVVKKVNNQLSGKVESPPSKVGSQPEQRL
jgi:hypothetical protein